MEFKHVSIMLEECMENLKSNQGKIFIDGTLGGGGHTEQILKNSGGIVIGFDKDLEAIAATKKRLEQFGDKLITIHGDFMNMANLLPKEFVGNVDGILLDLGVSSYQLDNKDRGFSYMNDGLLDMRMDNSKGISAQEVVNEYSKEKLKDIFYRYGEEKWSSRIADFIIDSREKKQITTTHELVEIIKKAIPAKARRDGPHPATRVFQAIRIEVNGELDKLGQAIESMPKLLKNNGRIAIITFHSLEDRIVKQVFKKMENPCECPPKLPMCVCGKKSIGKVISRKPIIPSLEEIEMNPRSRSAKLRIFEKKL